MSSSLVLAASRKPARTAGDRAARVSRRVLQGGRCAISLIERSWTSATRDDYRRAVDRILDGDVVRRVREAPRLRWDG